MVPSPSGRSVKASIRQSQTSDMICRHGKDKSGLSSSTVTTLPPVMLIICSSVSLRRMKLDNQPCPIEDMLKLRKSIL